MRQIGIKRAELSGIRVSEGKKRVSEIHGTQSEVVGTESEVVGSESEDEIEVLLPHRLIET